MRYTKLLKALLFTVMAGGCGEDFVRLEGAVNVDPAVARNFSADMPGRVLLHVRLSATGGFQSIGIVCGEAHPLRFPFQYADVGCAGAGTATGWIEPVAPGAGSVTCGPHVERWGSPKPSDARYAGVAMVFKENPGCGDHTEQNVEINVRP